MTVVHAPLHRLFLPITYECSPIRRMAPARAGTVAFPGHPIESVTCVRPTESVPFHQREQHDGREVRPPRLRTVRVPPCSEVAGGEERRVSMVHGGDTTGLAAVDSARSERGCGHVNDLELTLPLECRRRGSAVTVVELARPHQFRDARLGRNDGELGRHFL